MSVGSGGSSSNGQNGAEPDDVVVDRDPQDENWSLWGQIVNDWENFSKKKNPQLKVSFYPERLSSNFERIPISRDYFGIHKECGSRRSSWAAGRANIRKVSSVPQLAASDLKQIL